MTSPAGPPTSSRDVAVVGLAARFPGAGDVTAYRRLIQRGEVTVGTVPADRWRGAFDPDGSDPACSYTDVGAFLPDVTSFPARHFGMSARRAQVLDPQQRVLLDVVREAIDDSGLDMSRHGATAGVFVGASSTNFRDLLTASLRADQMVTGCFGAAADEALAAGMRELVRDVPPPRPFTMTGTLQNMVAAVVAQTFDLHGPSFVVDAACSSSLLALHEAMLHLRAGVCDLAVVGGVHVTLVPDAMVGFSRIGAISRSGQCRPFDQRGDGFVLGEGAGAVVLRRLSDAVTDGDKVYAVVKGSGASNDGRTSGPMAPAVEGQVLALRRAYLDAAVDPSTIGFVEAHGTGTTVGDAVEMAGLRAVLSPSDENGAVRGPCWVSAVKANIGHTMAAAGIAGLIKAVLVLGDEVIPPQPGPFTANPELDLGASRLAVAVEPIPWPAAAHPRRAAVSSFGFGGANAHVVLEAAASELTEAQTDTATAQPPALVLLSAPDRLKLAEYAARLAQTVRDNPSIAPQDIARDVAARPRRRHLLGVVAATADELADRLSQAVASLGADAPSRMPAAWGGHYGEHEPGTPPAPVTFVFPGQGAQRVGAARGLYEAVSRFRRRLNELAAVVHDATGVSPLAHLYPEGPQEDPAELAANLAATQVCQPVLTMLGLALSDLLQDAGVCPGMALGHSVGELGAATVAGFADPDDVLRLVAHRGQLMAQQAPVEPGAMLALNASEQQAQALLDGLADVWIANVNGPRQVVVSGHARIIDEVAERATAKGMQATPLAVSQAFHTPLVAPAGTALLTHLRSMPLRAGRIPVFSAVSGKPYGSPSEVLELLESHAVGKVDFLAAVGALEAHVASMPGRHAVVHLGPGRTGLGLVRAAMSEPDRAVFIPLTDDSSDPGRAFVEALAALAVLGHPVDPLAVHEHAARAPIVLPPPPLPVENYPLPGWSSSAQPPVVSTPAVPALPDSDPMPDPMPDPMTEDAMTDLVALFREQTEVLRLQMQSPSTEAAFRSPPAAGRQPAQPATTLGAAAVAVSASAAGAAVLEAVARVSGFPEQTLQPRLTLVDDLGFDSIMIAELVSQLRAQYPSASAVAESLSRDTTVGDLMAMLPEGHAADAVPASLERETPNSSPVQAIEPGPTMTQPADESAWRIERFPEVAALGKRLNLEHELNLRNPYFSLHERVVNDTSLVGGREVVNFSSYNYLGMSGDPAVSAAAHVAIDRYGTSVSASRLLSGDKPIHRELEAEIARTLGTEDSIVLVSGHATNVTVIAQLVGPGDLIVHDSLAHDSILQGCRLSGAVRRPFPHGDWQALDDLLRRLRPGFRRVLVALEGVYSMDGDIPDLPRFIEVKQRHRALLYVDEAHSFGTIGASGRGIGEHFGVNPADVDVWMGTLSKSLASCGGYIGGSQTLIQLLKYTAPGFIYSVGIPAPSAAASLAALQLMLSEPQRVHRLRERAELFLSLAQRAGIDTGLSRDTAVVPCVVGDSVRTLRLADALFARGINVNPILYPAVEEDKARLRFFITSCHSPEQIRETVDALAEELARLEPQASPVQQLVAATETAR